MVGSEVVCTNSMDTMRYTYMPDVESPSALSSESSGFIEESDDDDCQILGWRPSQRVEVPYSETRKRRNPHQSTWEPKTFGPKMKFSRCTRQGTSFSDPEIVHDSQNTLRKQWEEATLRRRTSHASQRSKAPPPGHRAQPAGRESTSLGTPGQEHGTSDTAQSNGVAPPYGDSGWHESVATSTDSEVQFTEVDCGHVGGTNHDTVGNDSGSKSPAVNDAKEDGLDGPSNRPMGCDGTPEAPALHMHSRTEIRVENRIASRSEPAELHGSAPTQLEVRSNDVHGASTSGQCDVRDEHDGIFSISNDNGDQSTKDAGTYEPTSAIASVPDLAGGREKMKQTADFKLADEEEWARRQEELQKQALEARKLRKRRKAEIDRKNEMENRQKQRLEEIRLSQQKEERNMGLKEQLRGQVQTNLERLASGCRDMATLLRRLDIQVEGGLYPTAQQVNTAYKKALLKFHPDRASALAQGDPLRQVEAEERFKLISRMKTTLRPVASPLF